jgi:dynein heavy chain
MEKAWSESHNKCPLICLLSPGADPTKLIEDLAKRKKIKTLGVSMGQVGEAPADVKHHTQGPVSPPAPAYWW